MISSPITAHDFTSEESYDEIPYPGGAHQFSHPCHLAMVGRLCGITPPPPRSSRVLELGCCTGANLIPMAEGMPDGQFVGVDFSSRQIATGQAAIKEIGIQNIELHHLGIQDLDESLGKFDYIICHGVFSWVSRDIQQAILDIGKRHLADNGIQYVSYNTYPGWHLRGVVREMMRYHVSELETPQQKISQARALLEFLAKTAKSRSQAYTMLLKEEAEILAKRLDGFVYHEQLEAVNDPVYFHEFIQRVDAAGLRYLADASISSMVAQMFDESAAEILKDVPLLRREQYMDLLRARMFRSSLLCHPDLEVNYAMPPSNLMDLHVTLRLPLVAEAGKNGEVVWTQPNGQLTTQMTITAAIEELNRRFPAWISVADLIDQVADDSTKENVLQALLMGMIRGFFRLAEDPISVCAEISEKPECTPLSRQQAKRGKKITSRFHADWTVQPQQRLLIGQLDGTRTVDELARLLHSTISDGRFGVTRNGDSVAPDAAECLRIVQMDLERLRGLGMLVG